MQHVSSQLTSSLQEKLFYEYIVVVAVSTETTSLLDVQNDTIHIGVKTYQAFCTFSSFVSLVFCIYKSFAVYSPAL